VFRLRINVPGPLRFRRLAVPQTSWNLIQYALERALRSTRFDRNSAVFLNIVKLYFEWITAEYP